jgi:hypothetical protein
MKQLARKGYIPEAGTLHNHRCNNLKYYVVSDECILLSVLLYSPQLVSILTSMNIVYNFTA